MKAMGWDTGAGMEYLRTWYLSLIIHEWEAAVVVPRVLQV